MMQTFLDSQNDIAALLEQAQRNGEVRIQRADGQTFVLKSETPRSSPLDVQGVELGISADEIVEFIRESKKQL